MKNKPKNNRVVMGKRILLFTVPFVSCLFVFLILAKSSGAASGWNWQFNLTSPAAKQPFQMPTSLFYESGTKRYYVVESGGNSLHSFQFDGQYLNTFGPEGVLEQPFAMVRLHSSGDLLVVEKGRNSLTKIDLKAKKVLPNTLEYKGETVYPDRIAVYDKKLYVLDKLLGNIITYGEDLQATTFYANPEKEGVFVDFIVKDDAVWALDAKGMKICQFNLSGNLKKQIHLLGQDLSFPVALEIGPSGYVYILDKHQGSVSVFDLSGNFKYTFLSKGHNNNELYLPEDILFDSLGRLCIVDTGNGLVRVFSR